MSHSIGVLRRSFRLVPSSLLESGSPNGSHGSCFSSLFVAAMNELERKIFAWTRSFSSIAVSLPSETIRKAAADFTEERNLTCESKESPSLMLRWLLGGKSRDLLFVHQHILFNKLLSHYADAPQRKPGGKLNNSGNGRSKNIPQDSRNGWPTGN